jgi:hypothetical protein
VGQLFWLVDTLVGCQWLSYGVLLLFILALRLMKGIHILYQVFTSPSRELDKEEGLTFWGVNLFLLFINYHPPNIQAHNKWMMWCHGVFMVVVLGEHDQYFMQGLLHPLFNFFHHFFNFLHFNFQFVNLILVCSHGICYDCIDWMTKMGIKVWMVIGCIVG